MTDFVTVNTNPNERTCGTCEETKEVSEFYRDGTDGEGNTKYRRDCKECYRKTRLMSRRPAPKPKPRGRRTK